MPELSALSYPKGVTYNFSLWGHDQPVSLVYEGQHYYGYLREPQEDGKYHIMLTERFEDGVSHRIKPHEIVLDDLSGVSFLHAHAH